MAMFQGSRLSDSSGDSSDSELDLDAHIPSKRRCVESKVLSAKDRKAAFDHEGDKEVTKRGERTSIDYPSTEGSDVDRSPPPAGFGRRGSDATDASYVRQGSHTSFYSDRRESQSTEDSYQPSDDEKTSNINKLPLVKSAKQTGYVDVKAKKMMERMGYKAGSGLGKHAQGRVDPIEVSKQRGRRGLGLHISGLEAATLEWNSGMEVISLQEEVKWLEEEEHVTLERSLLDSWRKDGPRKLTLNDETNFCDENLLRNVLASKSVFDELEPEEMRKARARSNPFETIRGGIFLNRAAMKMANMDKVFDFMFTCPKDECGEETVRPDELLYFADVCAGPGGFSEYVLWRKKWQAKGFGFTLKGENDFRLSDFFAGPCETFEPHYGAGGVDGDGDVFKPDNISAFTSYVMERTEGEGVHFMMADGGFSVDGQENIQEILSKQLYLCQFLVALSVVRVGGHFVCKVFDLFTPFSAGLVYLLHKSFVKIAIHKPNTSRPANSERYVVCKWKRDDCEDIRNYLFRINKGLGKLGSASDTDIVEVVPLAVMTDDERFTNFIVESNNSLGERQVVNLAKIAAFCRDTNLHEPRQTEMRRQSLEYWEVPDKARTAPPRTYPEVKCDELLKSSNKAFLSSSESVLTKGTLESVFKSVYDWHFVVLSSTRERTNCAFYLGLGRSRVYCLSENGRWLKVEFDCELSANTLVYADAVQELRGEGKSQIKTNSFHIVDALVLGGEDIRHLHLTTRLAMCRKFARALNKPSRCDLTPIRVKQLYDLEDVAEVFDRLELRTIKGGGKLQRMVYALPDEMRFYLPGGLLFLNATKDPWMRHLSRKTQCKYYCAAHKESKYDRDRPREACADFAMCFLKRHVWWWEEGTGIEDHGGAPPPPNPDRLSKGDLLEFVAGRTQ